MLLFALAAAATLESSCQDRYHSHDQSRKFWAIKIEFYDQQYHDGLDYVQKVHDVEEIFRLAARQLDAEGDPRGALKLRELEEGEKLRLNEAQLWKVKHDNAVQEAKVITLSEINHLLMRECPVPEAYLRSVQGSDSQP